MIVCWKQLGLFSKPITFNFLGKYSNKRFEHNTVISLHQEMKFFIQSDQKE